MLFPILHPHVLNKIATHVESSRYLRRRRCADQARCGTLRPVVRPDMLFTVTPLALLVSTDTSRFMPQPGDPRFMEMVRRMANTYATPVSDNPYPSNSPKS